MHWMDILFPSDVCPLCLRSVRSRFPWACTQCVRRLPRVTGTQCRLCGRPHPGQRQALCRWCSRSAVPFAWGQHLAIYEGHLQSHLRKLKFESRRGIARPLGALLGKEILKRRQLRRNTLVVPVPLHSRREIERGYNQAELLATAVGDVLRRHVVPRALVRTKETLSQAKLGADERLKNVKNAFWAPNPSLIRGYNILLVDDVFTTGATCRSAATALIRAGAASVAVACVAVAVSDDDLFA